MAKKTRDEQDINGEQMIQEKRQTERNGVKYESRLFLGREKEKREQIEIFDRIWWILILSDFCRAITDRQTRGIIL